MDIGLQIFIAVYAVIIVGLIVAGDCLDTCAATRETAPEQTVP
jgi:hypothetical protein